MIAMMVDGAQVVLVYSIQTEETVEEEDGKMGQTMVVVAGEGSQGGLSQQR